MQAGTRSSRPSTVGRDSIKTFEALNDQLYRGVESQFLGGVMMPLMILSATWGM